MKSPAYSGALSEAEGFLPFLCVLCPSPLPHFLPFQTHHCHPVFLFNGSPSYPCDISSDLGRHASSPYPTLSTKREELRAPTSTLPADLPLHSCW